MDISARFDEVPPLPEEQSSSVTTDINKRSDNEALFDVKVIPEKGRGLIARVDIPKGTRMLCEMPMFTVASIRDPGELERAIGTKLRSLSKEQQRQILSLHNNYPGRHALGGIVKTNALPCVDSGAQEGGIFGTAYLINHSCLSNAHNNWNPAAAHEKPDSNSMSSSGKRQHDTPGQRQTKEESKSEIQTLKDEILQLEQTALALEQKQMIEHVRYRVPHQHEYDFQMERRMADMKARCVSAFGPLSYLLRGWEKTPNTPEDLSIEALKKEVPLFQHVRALVTVTIWILVLGFGVRFKGCTRTFADGVITDVQTAFLRDFPEPLNRKAVITYVSACYRAYNASINVDNAFGTVAEKAEARAKVAESTLKHLRKLLKDTFEYFGFSIYGDTCQQRLREAIELGMENIRKMGESGAGYVLMDIDWF
ncbi:hypothetical protein B0H63DRAFT_506593 [Podospora didyma]|uniref:SET domain-containing protein n=1 Tax=Podospora didyma TaxID=330526 RepID=A0AAE0U8S7_9PEZI|nr:hypothetical protein B0H63DRAFT_506593 [Podospora didyma]